MKFKNVNHQKPALTIRDLRISTVLSKHCFLRQLSMAIFVIFFGSFLASFPNAEYFS